MEPTIHQWDDRLNIGKAGEAALDDYFKETGLVIREAEMKWQECGIDRWFIRKGFWLPVEYKTDFRAFETGNLFIETRKNCNGQGKAGWAKTTLAKRIYYYIPQIGKIYGLRPEKWQEHPSVLEPFRTVKAYNIGYHAEGVIIPFKELHYFTYAKYLDAPAFKNEESLLEWFEKYESAKGHQESDGK